MTAGPLAIALAAAPLQAAVLDPAGDFLPSFIGPHNGDLDVTRVDARLTGAGVRLTGEHAGAIGTTTGSAYVWGIDRGQGDDILADLVPSIGAGVKFDAVAILLADGTGFVVDLLSGAAPSPIDPSAISIKGSTISATIAAALLPSTGSSFAGYGYNLWPRFAPAGVDPADNTQLSDFAPDASTFTAAPVPLPAALGLQLAALVLLGALARKRRAGAE